MGADLYIHRITDVAKEKYSPLFEEAVKLRNKSADSVKEYHQKKVNEYYNAMYPDEGYFRDSYNGTNLLWTLNLSWWQDAPKYLDENGNLKGDKLSEFRDLIVSAPQHLPNREELIKLHCRVDEEGENSVEGWHKFFVEKRERLIKFLNSAIENKDEIVVSA